jgi:hypothetical protein
MKYNYVGLDDGTADGLHAARMRTHQPIFPSVTPMGGERRGDRHGLLPGHARLERQHGTDAGDRRRPTRRP